MPALASNRDKMGKLIETLEKQLQEKGEEINGYMEKHNIQVRGNTDKKEEVGKDAGEVKTGGVLVSGQEN